MAKPALKAEASKETAVQRLFITPLTFISFLFSLALVGLQNDARRARAHGGSASWLGRFDAFIHRLIWKRTPYAYVKGPATDAKTPDEKGKEGGEESWHWHTRQRGLMKAEMEDAYQMRKWVVVVLLGGSVMGMTAGLYGVRIAIEVLREGWHGWKF